MMDDEELRKVCIEVEMLDMNYFSGKLHKFAEMCEEFATACQNKVTVSYKDAEKMDEFKNRGNDLMALWDNLLRRGKIPEGMDQETRVEVHRIANDKLAEMIIRAIIKKIDDD